MWLPSRKSLGWMDQQIWPWCKWAQRWDSALPSLYCPLKHNKGIWRFSENHERKHFMENFLETSKMARRKVVTKCGVNSLKLVILSIEMPYCLGYAKTSIHCECIRECCSLYMQFTWRLDILLLNLYSFDKDKTIILLQLLKHFCVSLTNIYFAFLEMGTGISYRRHGSSSPYKQWCRASEWSIKIMNI